MYKNGLTKQLVNVTILQSLQRMNDLVLCFRVGLSFASFIPFGHRYVDQSVPTNIKALTVFLLMTSENKRCQYTMTSENATISIKKVYLKMRIFRDMSETEIISTSQKKQPDAHILVGNMQLDNVTTMSREIVTSSLFPTTM